MTLSDFFYLSDTEFTERLKHAKTHELLFDDKHNVRKRKGGKLGAWVGTAQAPFTLGIPFIGTAVSINRQTTSLPIHEESWHDTLFATLTVGASAAIGMGFAPGCEIMDQEFAEHGAVEAAQYLTGLAVGEISQNLGSVATEQASAKFTDMDTYQKKGK